MPRFTKGMAVGAIGFLLLAALVLAVIMFLQPQGSPGPIPPP